MHPPARPKDEAARLSALRALALMDTPPEEGFDRLTRLACRLFGVPMAAISLIDEERQWFKSRVGIPAAEIPRGASVCGHAILQDTAFVVPDAAIDPRFADNPFVTGETGMRFYAGHVLRSRDGHALGTLCVIDAAPRAFDAADEQALADLAAAATAELDRRRADRALDRQLAYMQLLEVIAVAANEATSIEGAIEFVLSRVCSLTGWVAGRYWEVSPDASRVVLTGHRHLDPDEDRAALQAALGDPSDPVLVHRVLATGHPSALDAVAGGGEIGSAHATFAFPACTGDRLLGVLEFFGPASAPADELLLDVMGHVGAQLGQVIERLHTQHVLTASQRQLAEAQDLAQLGSWEWDAVTDRLHLSVALCRLNGFEPGAVPLKLADYWATIHPEDRERLLAIAHDELVTRSKAEPYDARIIRPDGQIRVMSIRQEAVTDETGKLIKLFGTAQDVTERREAEVRLQASESQLAMSQALAHLGSWALDLASHETAWSDEMYRLLGYEPGAVTASQAEFYARLDEADGAKMWQIGEALVSGETDTVTAEYRLRRNDGAWRVMRGVTSVLRDETGRAVTMLGTAQDITDTKAAELALRESEERYRRFLELAPDAIAVLQDGRFTYLNSTGVKLLKAPGAQAILGRPVLDFIHPDYRPIVAQRIGGPGDDASGRTLPMEQVMLAVDGSPVDVEVTGIPIVVDGQLARLAMIRDVSDRRRAEQEMRESEELVRSIVESSRDAILLSDTEGRILSWNYGAERIFGYEADEALGQSITLIMPDRYRELHLAGMAAWRSERSEANASSGRTIEVTGRRKNGHEFPAELSLTFWTVRGKRFYSGIIRDLTERREIERLKGEFVTIVSHELRTPINTMLGALELLSTGMVGELPPRAARMVEIAFGNTGRLKRLVNDMLDIQLLEWGRLPIQLDRAEAADIMHEAADSVLAQAERLGISLEVNPLKAPVLADSDRIVQTLTNLLGNALKYTPAGGRVWLNAEIVDEEVTFEVGDTGRGIPADALPRVFEKYEQVAPGEAREKGGAGLGLSIARAIVERHQGRLWAESVVGEGTRFRFTLPVATVEGAAEPRVETPRTP
jgi:PAS domain S-box-containing protein